MLTTGKIVDKYNTFVDVSDTSVCCVEMGALSLVGLQGVADLRGIACSDPKYGRR